MGDSLFRLCSEGVGGRENHAERQESSVILKT